MEPGHKVTIHEADAYVLEAIHKSTEGVVFYPSKSAEKNFDLRRMRTLAQSLRQPAAHCFLERAIAAMEPTSVDGEPGYDHVPAGQAKIRARVSADGSVMQTEVLESGFVDLSMEECLRRAISQLKFPQSREGFAHHVDIIYWVSLGFHREAQTDGFLLHMRREGVQAAIRAKRCLKGRVGAGQFDVEGLNLFDRNGVSLANRVTRSGLEADVSSCVAEAFKGMRIHPERDAFVRPAISKVRFIVDAEGAIEVADEEWLRLVLLEERAEREERRRALVGGGDSAPKTRGKDLASEEDGFIDPGDDAGLDAEPVENPQTKLPEVPRPQRSEKKRRPPGTAQDPGVPGVKLRLNPR